MSGSSWGFCLAIYDFVGLILGHFGPMFGPTTYSVSWRAICWAYLGPSGHIGSFQGYVGPIGVLGHLEGYVEILEGYKAICGYFEPSVLELERSFWHQQKALNVHWRDTGAFLFWGLGGLCWVCLRPCFLHGSSIFEFLVLCCLQPLGLVCSFPFSSGLVCRRAIRHPRSLGQTQAGLCRSNYISQCPKWLWPTTRHLCSFVLIIQIFMCSTTRG